MKYSIISFLVGSTLSAFLVLHYLPKKTETRTVVQEHTVTRIVERKDGTTITVVDSTKNTSKEKTKSKSEMVAKNWHAGLVLSQDAEHLTMLKPAYGAMVERRIIGPIFVGAHVTPGQSAGLLITVEF